MKRKSIAFLAFFLLLLSIIAEGAVSKTGSLGGIVLTPDGKKGAKGVVVKVLDPERGTLIAGAKTDAYGIYRIGEIPEGSYVIGVETKEGVFIGRSLITIEPGKVSMIPLRLVRGKGGSIISGTIYREDGRTPLSSIGIRVIDATTKTLVAKAISGTKGKFLIAGIPGGSYVLVFERRGGEYILESEVLKVRHNSRLKLTIRLRVTPPKAEEIVKRRGLVSLLSQPEGLAEIISQKEGGFFAFIESPKGAALIISSALIPPTVLLKKEKKASPDKP